MTQNQSTPELLATLLIKQEQLLQDYEQVTNQIKQVKKDLRVPKVYSQEFRILVAGVVCTKEQAKDAWRAASKSQTTLYVEYLGKRYLVGKFFPFRGGAKCYRAGFYYATSKVRERFKDVFGAKPVGGFYKPTLNDVRDKRIRKIR